MALYQQICFIGLCSRKHLLCGFSIHLHMNQEGGRGVECVGMKKKKIQTDTAPPIAYVILVMCSES